jgi:hypothetical protein
MSQPSGKPICIPPFSGVRLIECRDHFQLVPVPSVRTTYGYGRIKASKARVDSDEINPVQFWTDLGPDDEIWCVMQWFIYEDGHQEPGNISFLRPECTEEEAKKSMERMMGLEDFTRENPPTNGIKFFATAELLENSQDRQWLVRMSATIYQHWHRKNVRQQCRLVNLDGAPDGHAAEPHLSPALPL